MSAENVQNIYRLLPIQNTLLHRHLQSPDDDPGLLQVVTRLRGKVDIEVMSKAWQVVTDRHESLRSSIHWETTSRPVQVVHRRVQSRFEARSAGRDSSHRSADPDDVGRLNLTKAPVDRMSMVSWSNGEHELRWTTHHILLDGWSAAIILKELFQSYGAILNGHPPPPGPAPSLSLYHDWLDRQDTQAAEYFWADYLSGIHPSRQQRHRQSSVSSSFPFPHHEVVFNESDEQSVRDLLGSTSLTLSRLVQIAVATTLAKMGRGHDIVVGTTNSGRPPEISGIDLMTGVFVSAAPVRVKLDVSENLSGLADRLLRIQGRWTKHSFLPLERIQRVTGSAAGVPLFDTLVVTENFPWRQVHEIEGVDFEVAGFEGGLTTTLPLTVVISDSDRLNLKIYYDPAEHDADEVREMTGILRDAMIFISMRPDAKIGDLIGALHEPTIRPNAAPRPGGSIATPAVDRPLDSTEMHLARLWSSILGVRPIGRHDDFFDLGGRSLQTVELFEKIESEFGRTLPLSAMFEGRTLERMAEILREGRPAATWKTIVPLQPYGDRPPLYCFHAGEGNVNFYYDLARSLGPDQPVFGVQAVGLDGHTEPLSEFEAMTSLYADEIESVQGKEACALVGLCFGTKLAVGVAERLRARGCRVVLQVAIDTAPINPNQSNDKGGRSTARLASENPKLSDKLARHLQHIARGDWDVTVVRVLRRIQLAREHLASVWIDRFGSERQKLQQRVAVANHQAEYGFEQRHVEVPVLLIRSQEFAERSEKRKHLSSWSELAVAGLEVVVLEGSKHSSLLREPAVRVVADQITRRLVEVTRTIPSSASLDP